MSNFPYDSFEVGQFVRGRTVTNLGAEENTAKFSQWKDWRVHHVQRDAHGKICCLAFTGWGIEFDPRHDWEPGGPWPCLMTGPYQFQFPQDTRTGGRP